MKALLELMPIAVLASLGDVCKGLFKSSQKAASIRAAVDELKQHKDAGMLPASISIKPITV